jgi:hypothetical protein
MRIFEDKIIGRPATDSGQLMLYREIMAVCSEIHTKHINTVCGAERRVVEC